MSTPEDLLLAQIHLAGLPEPEREFRFWPGRRFKFDFAYPDRMIACEVEGGTWMKGGGRHSRGAGYQSDCIKYSEAALRGWKVIRCTSQMVTSGEAITLLRRALEEPTCKPTPEPSCPPPSPSPSPAEPGLKPPTSPSASPSRRRSRSPSP